MRETGVIPEPQENRRSWTLAVHIVLAPLSLLSSFTLVQKAFHSRGLLPAYLPKSSLALAFRCLGLASVPLLLLSCLLFQLSLLHYERSKLYQMLRNSLSNIFIQSLLFGLNLLAFSTLSIATGDRQVLVTALFVLAGVLFWLGYYLVYLTEWEFWSLPGMALTVTVNFTLLYYNLVEFFS